MFLFRAIRRACSRRAHMHCRIRQLQARQHELEQENKRLTREWMAAKKEADQFRGFLQAATAKWHMANLKYRNVKERYREFKIVVGRLNHELNANSRIQQILEREREKNAKISHLMLICREQFGAALPAGFVDNEAPSDEEKANPQKVP